MTINLNRTEMHPESKHTRLASSSSLPYLPMAATFIECILLLLLQLVLSLPLPSLSPSLKTDHHCQHKNNDVQLFTYAHSLFPYELKRISPPPPPSYSSSPLSLRDNAIYNTADADEENFLITLTAFRRRPMDDDRVGRLGAFPLPLPQT